MRHGELHTREDSLDGRCAQYYCPEVSTRPASFNKGRPSARMGRQVSPEAAGGTTNEQEVGRRLMAALSILPVSGNPFPRLDIRRLVEYYSSGA